MDAPADIILDEEEYFTFLAISSHFINAEGEEIEEDEVMNAAAKMARLRELLQSMDDDSKLRALNGRPEPGEQGMLLLNMAVAIGNLEACQILVAHGANLQGRDGPGFRAIDYLYIPELEIPNKEALRAWLTAQHIERST